MQFRMAPHQTKKGKHETNTSDVLRTGEGQTAARDRELLSRLCRLDAGGEDLDEFGSPSRSSASLSEGWWEEMLVGEGAA